MAVPVYVNPYSSLMLELIHTLLWYLEKGLLRSSHNRSQESTSLQVSRLSRNKRCEHHNIRGTKTSIYKSLYELLKSFSDVTSFLLCSHRSTVSIYDNRFTESTVNKFSVLMRNKRNTVDFL